MVEEIIIITGLGFLIKALFLKFGLHDKLQIRAARAPHPFFIQLVGCHLCLFFHLSVLTTAGYCAFNGFHFYDLVVPFVAAGFLSLKNY